MARPTNDKIPDVSVVLPVYNEEESIALCVQEIHEALGESSLTYEIICVDDGSADRSFEVLSDLARKNSRVGMIRFRRNFGQTAALQCGITEAVGRVVVPMDADLQNDPRDIPRMVARLDEGYDMAVGWRRQRQDTFLSRRLPSLLANRLIGAITGVRIHDYGCTLKAIRQELAKELRLYGEMHRFIPALANAIGASITEMEVNHRARRYGKTKYGISRTVRVLLDLLTVHFLQRYRARPMHLFGTMSFGFFVVGLLCAGLLGMASLWDRGSLPWANGLLVCCFALLFVQTLIMGLNAEVLARTYFEAQHRAPYYIRERIVPGHRADVQAPEVSRVRIAGANT